MFEINGNYTSPQPVQVNISKPVLYQQDSKDKITIDEYYRWDKRKDNGLVEKFYNWIKNITNLGVGSNKVENAITDAKSGTISAEQAGEIIHYYSSSQENSAQLLGDAVSISVAGFTFFGLNKIGKWTNAYTQVNKPLVDIINKYIKENEELLKTDTKMLTNKRKLLQCFTSGTRKIINTITSKNKLLGAATIISALAGGFSKYYVLKFNRIGSNEFKVDKEIYGNKKERTPEQKAAVKTEKKQLNAQRRKTNFKNFLSGTINGIMMPVIALGGLIGAPIYLAGNSLSRYFIANKTDKNKSINGYVKNLTNDSLTTGLTMAALAIPLVKKGNFTKTFNGNIEKSIKKLANADLKNPEYNGTSVYKQLEDMLLDSPSIRDIINGTMPIDEQIKVLTKENLFAVKFKQISGDKTPLSRALKDNCPPTRTISEAQEFINNNAGNGYKVTKLLGVGTVAETYLAKDKSGEEVCIKILKNGITREKILNDKEKFVELVKNMKDVSKKQKDYLLRNIDDLADGILKEVDLKNEMEAAKKLIKCTNTANVVKPIEVKNNVYIMKKADGVSLASFLDINRLYIQKDAITKLNNGAGVTEIEKQIEALKSRMPDFGDIKFDPKDTDYLVNEYQKVFIEQFHKINKNGKSIHADIHPGNIFINPEALRNRRGKIFTLIDTGNVIDMNVEQSLHALNLTNYVKYGNTKDIAEYVIQGAKLPVEMSEKEAVEKVTAELKKYFFDNKTKLEKMNNERILVLADNIMQKLDIIPSSTQLNLIKSRTSAKNSLEELKGALLSFDIIDVIKHKNSILETTLASGKTGLKVIARNRIYDEMIAKQEKENLKQLTKAQILKQKNNPNNPKKSSEDYITYNLKQIMLGDINFMGDVI